MVGDEGGTVARQSGENGGFDLVTFYYWKSVAAMVVLGKTTNDLVPLSARYFNIQWGCSIWKILPRSCSVKWFFKKDSDSLWRPVNKTTERSFLAFTRRPDRHPNRRLRHLLLRALPHHIGRRLGLLRGSSWATLGRQDSHTEAIVQCCQNQTRSETDVL